MARREVLANEIIAGCVLECNFILGSQKFILSLVESIFIMDVLIMLHNAL